MQIFPNLWPILYGNTFYAHTYKFDLSNAFTLKLKIINDEKIDQQSLAWNFKIHELIKKVKYIKNIIINKENRVFLGSCPTLKKVNLHKILETKKKKQKQEMKVLLDNV